MKHCNTVSGRLEGWYEQSVNLKLTLLFGETKYVTDKKEDKDRLQDMLQSTVNKN